MIAKYIRKDTILFSLLLLPFFNCYPQEFQQDDVERLLCVSRDNGVVLEEENTENVTSKKGRVNEISEQQRLCQLHKDGISAKFYNFHQPIHFRVPPRFSNTRNDLFSTPKRGKQFRETPFSAESNIPWSLYTPGSDIQVYAKRKIKKRNRWIVSRGKGS